MKHIQFDENFEVGIDVHLDASLEIDNLAKLVAKKLGVSKQTLPALEVKKRSIDARGKKLSFYVTLGLKDDDRPTRLNKTSLPEVTGAPIIIVGAGPAGLFCAYELARQKRASIVLDRGKMVQARRKDLKGLNQHGVVDVDSNYCFGEGGAGTYSDGKLYTRSHKRGNVRDVLETLVSCGADPNILTDARPHIGSNKLPKVITAMRERLEQAGVVFHFGARVSKIVVDNGCARGVKLHDGQEFMGDSIVIATGHSSRDIYEHLHEIGVHLEEKPFAMGVRIEHRQEHINQIQYGAYAGHKNLPAAYYKLAYTPQDQRGTFSFCMCPGGWIVPAATEPEALVVNGMSLSKRNSRYANSGLVVAITPKDLARCKEKAPLRGIALQNAVEQQAFTAGGGLLVAPAVRVTDFIKGVISKDLPDTSYLPGITPADMSNVLNSCGLSLAERLREALLVFDKKMPGYVSESSILVGVETRTSSPVRIARDSNCVSSLAQLYPCGEGAGYAGGIVSAAMDGINVARKIISRS